MGDELENHLDRAHFVLDEEDWEFFQSEINKPISERPNMKELLDKKPSWE